MALQIGRVGIDVALDNPEVWDWSGETVQVSGELYAATVHDVKVLRQQLLGYVNNPDEPIVPVTWSEDSHADGYYRVLSAEVSTVAGSYSAFWFPFSCTLQRIPDYAAPLIESILLSPGARTNDHGLVGFSTYHWHALPATAIGYAAGVLAIGVPLATRTSADGTLNYYNNAALTDTVATYTLPVADWYDGACRIEYDYPDNGTFRVATGRQVPNLPNDARWRIGNGVLRVEINSTTDFKLGIQRWISAAYSTSKIFNVGTHAASEIVPFTDPDSLVILRNSPEEVVVRLSVRFSAATPVQVYTVDLRLQRGAPYVELQITSGGTDDVQVFGVGRATNETSTTLTGAFVDAGIKANANDGDGFRYFIVCPLDTTLDTTDGDAWLTVSATTASFAVGLADPETTPIFDEAEDHASEYIAAMSETMRVVER